MLEYFGLFVSPGDNVVDYARRVVDRVREKNWMLVTGDEPTSGLIAVWKAVEEAGYPNTSIVTINHDQNPRPRVWSAINGEQPINLFRYEDYLGRDRLIVDTVDKSMFIWNGKGAAVWEAYQYALEGTSEVFFVDFTKGNPVVTTHKPKISQLILA